LIQIKIEFRRVALIIELPNSAKSVNYLFCNKFVHALCFYLSLMYHVFHVITKKQVEQYYFPNMRQIIASSDGHASCRISSRTRTKVGSEPILAAAEPSHHNCAKSDAMGIIANTDSQSGSSATNQNDTDATLSEDPYANLSLEDLDVIKTIGKQEPTDFIYSIRLSMHSE